MSDDVIASWPFTVGRSFLGRGHAITARQKQREAIRASLGGLSHSQRRITIITVDGAEAEGTVRHSQTNGVDYVQFNSADPEVAAGLRLGEVIRVELLKSDLQRPVLRLSKLRP